MHTVLCRHRLQDRGWGLGIKSGEKEEKTKEKRKGWLIMKVFQIAFLRRSGSWRSFRALVENRKSVGVQAWGLIPHLDICYCCCHCLSEQHPPDPPFPRSYWPQGRIPSLNASVLLLSTFLSASAASIASSGKSHFWFVYKFSLWSMEVIWSHYSGSMRVTIGDSEWNCYSVLEDAQRVK